jgi:tripartite-type tricarboxylate transporter receptor subunit TctC
MRSRQHREAGAGREGIVQKTALRTIIGSLGCLFALSVPALGQQFPSKPIEIVVPFAPGGSIDITMRTIAPSLSKRLGQTVLVVNKPGGGATIGMNSVAKAAPDGHTLGAASFAFAANPSVLDSVPFDTVKDFEPVTLVARSPMLVLVNPKSPVTNLKEFIEWVKSKPGELNYGSVGMASSGHLISELFLARAGLKMKHIPFTAGPLPQLAQGTIHLQIGPIPSSIPWVRDGRLRAIAVTSIAADPSVPELDPVSKTLPGFDTFEWPALVAPAGTPREIIERIQREVALTIAEPEIKERLAFLGSQGSGGPPEELRALVQKEMTMWAEVARDLKKSGEIK